MIILSLKSIYFKKLLKLCYKDNWFWNSKNFKNSHFFNLQLSEESLNYKQKHDLENQIFNIDFQNEANSADDRVDSSSFYIKRKPKFWDSKYIMADLFERMREKPKATRQRSFIQRDTTVKRIPKIKQTKRKSTYPKNNKNKEKWNETLKSEKYYHSKATHNYCEYQSDNLKENAFVKPIIKNTNNLTEFMNQIRKSQKTQSMMHVRI